MKKPVSLGDRLKVAKSTDEIAALLLEGAAYDMADPATRRRWKRLAARRTEALSNPPAPATPTSEPAVKKTAGNKSKSSKNNKR